MFVGYAKHHGGNCYRMLNLKTMGVHESRDIIWLHQMFFSAPAPSIEHTIIPAVALNQQEGERDNNALVD